MRHFKLVNDLKQVFDLTTTENLFARLVVSVSKKITYSIGSALFGG